MTDKEVHAINRSYEIAVRNLNSQAWNVMLPSEKLNDLQSIENKIAIDQNRIPCEVCMEPMREGQWGYSENNKIVINSNEINNPNFMEHINTVYHEASHAREAQARDFQEVRSQFTSEELTERNTPVPNPQVDFEGYWNHPAEVAARKAGEEGVEKTANDREHILEVDRQMNQENHMNQILQTYDYNALEIPLESAPAAKTTQESEVSANISGAKDVSGDADSVANTGMDIGAPGMSVDSGTFSDAVSDTSGADVGGDDSGIDADGSDSSGVDADAGDGDGGADADID